MINDSYIESEYFRWLLEHCSVPYDRGLQGYSKVLELLFDTEFYALDDLDANRIDDSLILRDTFMELFEVCTVDKKILDEMRVSCLEILVALAERFESEIAYDCTYGNRTSYWLYDMLNNLHILIRNRDYNVYERYIVHRIYDWMDRNIDGDHLVSPFFVDGISGEEARETQLWELGQRYYTENKEWISTVSGEDSSEIWR